MTSPLGLEVPAAPAAQVAKHSALLAVSAGLVGLLSYLCTLLMAHLLPTVQYTQYAAAQMLVGIVGMQVENLKLNAGLGNAIEQTSTLQSRNDWLRDDVAQLSNPQRIEAIAARHGMLMGPPSATKFLTAGNAATARAAIAGIHAPGSTYFAGPAGTLSAAAAAAAPGSTTAPAG